MFAGHDGVKQFERDERLDAVVLVYNGHAFFFDIKFKPTFALGCVEEFPTAD